MFPLDKRNYGKAFSLIPRTRPQTCNLSTSPVPRPDIPEQCTVETWPDDTTRGLLTQRAVEDPDGEIRGLACSALGKMHSEFGRILPTRDLDGVAPYLDPLEPIPRDHIEKAAKECGILPEDIDAQVASLSAHFGWDITRGAKPSRQTPKRKRKR